MLGLVADYSESDSDESEDENDQQEEKAETNKTALPSVDDVFSATEAPSFLDKPEPAPVVVVVSAESTKKNETAATAATTAPAFSDNEPVVAADVGKRGRELTT